MACFGREGCRLAYKYLLKNNDVAEAKRIAATYCVEHLQDCIGKAEEYERGKRLESLIGALIPGGRYSAGALKSLGCKCFLAGTDVLMADGSTKDIKDVQVGDQVTATDPETGESGSREVTRLIVTDSDKHFNELTLQTDNGPKKIRATHEHPFWVPALGQWVEAGSLTPGITLRKPDGTTVTVIANRAYSKRARTYNLTVDDLHTYYVLAGGTPVLVHNSNGCGVTRGPDGRFQSDPNRVAPNATYDRVTLRSSTKQAVQDAAPRDADGNFIDPNTGQSIPAEGPFHYGHKPGFEYWRNRDMAQAQGWTREQFIEFENDPSHYQIEDPYNNMSHQYEQP